jgi:hypothetical protein
VAYADLATVQTTDPGDVLTAAWCDQVRDNEEFLIDPPACSVFASGAQSVADDTGTDLTANSENFDNDSMHSTSSDTARITIQTPGRYLVFGQVVFAADADGRRALLFRVNNTTDYNVQAVLSVGAINSMAISGVRALTLAAGDYVTCRVVHTAGGSLNVTLNEFASFFMTRA